jgi:DNA-directed RNA polymerase specialized sigma24 family protein
MQEESNNSGDTGPDSEGKPWKLPDDWPKVEQQVRCELQRHFGGDLDYLDDAIQEAVARHHEQQQHDPVDPQDLVFWLRDVARRSVQKHLRRSKREMNAGDRCDEFAERGAVGPSDEAAECVRKARGDFVNRYRNERPQVVLVALLSRFSPIQVKATPHKQLAVDLGVSVQTIAEWWRESKPLILQELQRQLIARKKDEHEGEGHG